MSTEPPVPSLAITRFGTTSPPATLIDDAIGLATPLGHTVRYDGADASTAVTLSTAATAVLGTPIFPATGTVMVPADPIGVAAPSRVSSRRAGTMPTKSDATAAPPLPPPTPPPPDVPSGRNMSNFSKLPPRTVVAPPPSTPSSIVAYSERK